MEARHRRLIAFLVACVFAAFASAASAQTTRPAVEAVLRVGIVVEDIDRSLAFFAKTLDFKPVEDRTDDVSHTRVARLKLADETIELIDYLTPGGREVPRDSRSNDRWFQHIAIVTTDMDAAVARLQQNHVRPASVSPQRLRTQALPSPPVSSASSRRSGRDARARRQSALCTHRA